MPKKKPPVLIHPVIWKGLERNPGAIYITPVELETIHYAIRDANRYLVDNQHKWHLSPGEVRRRQIMASALLRTLLERKVCAEQVNSQIDSLGEEAVARLLAKTGLQQAEGLPYPSKIQDQRRAQEYEVRTREAHRQATLTAHQKMEEMALLEEKRIRRNARARYRRAQLRRGLPVEPSEFHKSRKADNLRQRETRISKMLDVKNV